MVSLKLDFYEYRDEIRKTLLRHKSELDVVWDPFKAAWLAYAIACEGTENNPYLAELIDSLGRWAHEPKILQFRRYLGPLFLWVYLRGKQGQVPTEAVQHALKELNSLNIESKFSPLRDPEQVFLISLGVALLGNEAQEAKNLIAAVANQQAKGPIKRRLLYSAALKELSCEVKPPANIESRDPADIITWVWWSRKYCPDVEPRLLWQMFDNIKDGLVFSDNPEGHQRIVSESELAILYEAILNETKHPDPNLLFSIYPLHPRIKQIAGSLFQNGEYANAVFEALKAINDYIKTRTGLQQSEIQLVIETFGDPSTKEIRNPRLRFNPLDPSSLDYRSQQNEQRGLAHLISGAFFAFRHPKGHEPKDKAIVALGPYEAIDQLVSISYLMKRIEEAK